MATAPQAHEPARELLIGEEFAEELDELTRRNKEALERQARDVVTKVVPAQIIHRRKPFKDAWDDVLEQMQFQMEVTEDQD